ncbi:MAG: glycosyltransferase family 4 protein [Sphingomicrobium sp.]
MKLFYATTAPADFINAHRAWAAGTDYDREVSITFSSQVEDFIAEMDAPALMVSGHPNGERLTDGPTEIRHMPKAPRTGWRWHVEDYRHARGLIRLATDFGADIAVVDSGTMPFPSLISMQRRGIKVIPVFHNTLYRPTGPSLAQRLERPWARKFLSSTTPVHVSPACKRQVGHGLEIRAQFRREQFEKVAPAQFARPFNVLFVGRILTIKGVFDIVEAARLCGDAVTWTICGTGSDLEGLKQASRGLPIDIRGWTSVDELNELRSRCQAVIVPTRTDFEEGMAMTAVEAILAGRPLITNAVVPALEVLRPACVEAEPENPRSIADAVLGLSRGESRWQSLVDACPALQAPFYDPRHGLTAALTKILCPERSDYIEP